MLVFLQQLQQRFTQPCYRLLLAGLLLCADSNGIANAAPSALTLPQVELINQDQQAVMLNQQWLAGRTLVIQFVFTRCGIVCPVLGYQFGLLRRRLVEVTFPVELVSITVDPVHDSPEVLARWAERYGAGPGWTQLSGDKTAIDAVLKAFRAFSPDIAEHTSLILVINADADYWQRLEGSAPVQTLFNAIHASQGAAVTQTRTP